MRKPRRQARSSLFVSLFPLVCCMIAATGGSVASQSQQEQAYAPRLQFKFHQGRLLQENSQVQGPDVTALPVRDLSQENLAHESGDVAIPDHAPVVETDLQFGEGPLHPEGSTAHVGMDRTVETSDVEGSSGGEKMTRPPLLRGEGTVIVGDTAPVPLQGADEVHLPFAFSVTGIIVCILLMGGIYVLYKRVRPNVKAGDFPVVNQPSQAPRSWESSSLSVLDARFPKLICPQQPAVPNGPPARSGSALLSDAHIRAILKHLPIRYTGSDWNLLYSSDAHGCCLKTMYRKVYHSGPVIIVAMDSHGYVFGGFASEDIRESYRYFGNGESFVMKIHPEFKVFRWTHENNLFVLANPDHLAFGGGGAFALFFDAFFERGTSGHSATYGNEVLASKETFKCLAVEVWGFV